MCVNPCFFGLTASTTFAEMDILQDRLLGIRVNPDCFSNLIPTTPGRFEREDKAEIEAAMEEMNRRYYDDLWGDDGHHVPFVVIRYTYDEGDHGFPEDLPVSFHRTRKGAEIEMAHLEDMGTNPRHLRIVEDYFTCWPVQIQE